MNSKLVDIIIQTEKRSPELTNLWTYGETDGGKIYSFLNPVSYLDALKHKNLFCQMDGVFADGSLLVSAIKLLYGVKVTRRSFDMTSLAPELLNYATENGKSVYIVASKQEQVEQAVIIIREKYKGINIVGYRNGYFANEEEKDKEARHIVDINPDFLIVGMGVIMQEQFLLKVKKVGYQGIGFTCGGFIHQISKNMINYYPAWMDRMNLRFVYRMWKEPHTRKRYLKAGLLFPPRFLWERLFG
ncbi:MAG: WecB/TagA/CpsF family glycosyltransferase [Prevotella sp.]|nr:WecB/TagA/CpsF family glycosyltransferase [Prevotella sp.]